MPDVDPVKDQIKLAVHELWEISELPEFMALLTQEQRKTILACIERGEQWLERAGVVWVRTVTKDSDNGGS